MRRIAWLAVAIGTSAAGPGCQTMMSPASLSALAQPAASGFSYSAGRAIQSYAFAPQSVELAAVSAMDDLRIHSIRRTSEEGTVVLEGTTADNRRASITLHPQNAGTRVSTRFGLFGDEPLSRAFMDRVNVRLGALPPSAVPVDLPSEPGKNPFFSRAAISDEAMLKDKADAPFSGSAFP